MYKRQVPGQLPARRAHGAPPTSRLHTLCGCVCAPQVESAGDKERLQRQVDACVEARKSAASTLRKAETQLSLAKQTELLALQQKDEMKRSVGRRLWATLAKHVPERHTRARRPQTPAPPVHRSLRAQRAPDIGGHCARACLRQARAR